MNAPLPSNVHTQAGQLVCQYINAFNARDFEAMKSVFHPQLVTVHPNEPEIDVTEATPFLERMVALWPRDLHYTLRRICDRSIDAGSEAWAEIVIGKPNDAPLAAEVVIYHEQDGCVTQLTVYKLMHPSHPAY